MTVSPTSYILDWDPTNACYCVIRLNPLTGNVDTSPPFAAPGPDKKLIPIGNYIIEWQPATGEHKLWRLDSACADLFAGAPLQTGQWSTIKSGHELIPVGRYAIDWVPERGTCRLWQFDPQRADTLAGNPHEGDEPLQCRTWNDIKTGHQLVPIGNYVLDWVPDQRSYRLWQFDPQSEDPLARSTITNGPVQTGTWADVTSADELIPVGNFHIMAWRVADGSYRILRFDPTSPDPLHADQPVSTGVLAGTVGHTLVGVQPLIPLVAGEHAPGTLEFMRAKIKKIVYFILENRSVDHVLGWLYENDAPTRIIARNPAPYDGARTDYHNYWQGQRYPISKFQDGQLGHWFDLNVPTKDSNHDHVSIMKQLFGGDYAALYADRAAPSMGGFVWNNETPEIMETYSPEQLPVLNGLARAYGVSDEWFCSIPGPTDVNRAFCLTGSSYGRTENFESGWLYYSWPRSTHRASIWSTLWAHGFDDWKVYFFNTWHGFCFTYHLYLNGQIPTVNSNRDAYIKDFHEFITDAASGNLPRFSFIEPAWVGSSHPYPPNSYHPPMDLVTGEQFLCDIYNAVLSSPDWQDTLMIITFDEHGGVYDHASPPYGEVPFANDLDDDFRFDLFGVRVPTILISPWIEEKTVFRSLTETPYDGTSFLSTILNWYGIPRQKWALGERANHAPTFESVFTRTSARTDKPMFQPPFDGGEVQVSRMPIHDWHVTMVPRIVWSLGAELFGAEELQRIADDILDKAQNVADLHARLTEFKERVLGMLG